MPNVIFFHTNRRRMLGALVARHAVIRHSAAPEQIGYVGLTVMTDPDVFVLADINALFERGMGAVARWMPGPSPTTRPACW